MKDENKTKEQLIDELVEIRQQLAELEAADTQRTQAEEALRDSEEQYRSFVQNFRGIAFRGRMDFTPIFLSGAAEEITGYTEREFLDGKPRWDQVIHPEDLPALFTEDEERLHSIPHYSYEREYRIVRKDGAVRWVHEVIQNVCDDSGKPAIVQGAIYDITERKRAEEALRESEEKYRQLFELESDAIFLIDNETGGILEVNAVGSALYGYSREDLLQKKNTDLSAEPDETRRATVEGWTRVPVRFHRKKDGTVFPVEITGRHFTWRGREVHIAAIRDITERLQAEEEIRRLARFPSENPNPVLRVARDGTILYANEASLPLLDVWGCQQGQPLPDNRRKLTLDVLGSGSSKDAEVEVEDRILCLTFAPVVEAHYGNVYGLDITERVRAEEALRESEERFRQFFENELEYCYMISPEGVILDVNSAALKAPSTRKRSWLTNL